MKKYLLIGLIGSLLAGCNPKPKICLSVYGCKPEPCYDCGPGPEPTLIPPEPTAVPTPVETPVPTPSPEPTVEPTAVPTATPSPTPTPAAVVEWTVDVSDLLDDPTGGQTDLVFNSNHNKLVLSTQGVYPAFTSVASFDATTGEQQWERSFLEGYAYADQDAIFTIDSSGPEISQMNNRLSALDLDAGATIWQQTFKRRFNLLDISHPSTMIVQALNKDYLPANDLFIDKKSGKVVFKSKTPLAYEWGSRYSHDLKTSYSFDLSDDLSLKFVAATAKKNKQLWQFDETVFDPTDFLEGDNGLVYLLLQNWMLGAKLVALDSKTGELKWDYAESGNSLLSQVSNEGFLPFFNGPTGEVMVLASDNGMRALDAATGSVLWENVELTDYEHQFAHVASGTLILWSDQGAGKAMGLDATTGVVKWQTKGAARFENCTDFSGQVLCKHSHGINVLDPGTGLTQWRYEYFGSGRAGSIAINSASGIVYIIAEAESAAAPRYEIRAVRAPH